MSQEKVKEVRAVAVARTISMTEEEWNKLENQATKWKTSRSGAFRRIWIEWQQTNQEIFKARAA